MSETYPVSLAKKVVERAIVKPATDEEIERIRTGPSSGYYHDVPRLLARIDADREESAANAHLIKLMSRRGC